MGCPLFFPAEDDVERGCGVGHAPCMCSGKSALVQAFCDNPQADFLPPYLSAASGASSAFYTDLGKLHMAGNGHAHMHQASHPSQSHLADTPLSLAPAPQLVQVNAALTPQEVYKAIVSLGESKTHKSWFQVGSPACLHGRMLHDCQHHERASSKKLTVHVTCSCPLLCSWLSWACWLASMWPLASPSALQPSAM
jgi:hypothetical protein